MPSTPDTGDSSHRILVAPLNWGLGHVARCVPLIRFLERMGAKVFLASDGAALQLLKEEFPHLPAFQLPSYRIRYQSENMIRNIAWQLPRITYAVRAEQWATERLVRTLGITGIISDNRYGCFSKRTRNVILTHQIHLRIPNAALEWCANQILRRALRKFQAIWVPDNAQEPNLSGALSHPTIRGFEIAYLGILSRMTAQSNQEIEPGRVAVVLSGPEPQRSYLEQILLEQAMTLPYKFVFVKGKPRTKEHHYISENVEVVSYLTSGDLHELLHSCELVVCRAGYSSLMDLAALGNKKAVLIPTPGQTEQLYLADIFAESGVFVCEQQDRIDLENALEAAKNTTGIPAGQFDTAAFGSILADWLSKS